MPRFLVLVGLVLGLGVMVGERSPLAKPPADAARTTPETQEARIVKEFPSYRHPTNGMLARSIVIAPNPSLDALVALARWLVEIRRTCSGTGRIPPSVAQGTMLCAPAARWRGKTPYRKGSSDVNKEGEFTKYMVIPTLHQVGFTRIRYVHGMDEHRRDVVFFDRDRLGQESFHAAQVKFGDLRGT
jgi:hypothetical protein